MPSSVKRLAGGSWRRREAQLLRAFVLSQGESDATLIAQMAGCSEAQGHQVAAARRLVCIEVLDRYARGQITFGQLWNAAKFPEEPARQLATVRLPRG